MKPFTFNCVVDGKKCDVLFDLDVSDTISKFLKAGKLYEPEVTMFLLRVLREGDLFVDVGAHVGYFSSLAGKLVGEKGGVISFEPEETNCKRLRYHLDLNGLSNVTVFQKPVAAKVETRAFYVNSDGDGGHALWDPALFPGNEESKANPKPYEVQTVTLEEAFRQAGVETRPKLIKIDTEGAECSVLEGASVILEDHTPSFVICELHEFGLRQFGYSQEDLRAFMKNYGFETFLLSPSGNLPKLVPDGVRIESKFILNLLFSRPESLCPYWPVELVDSPS